MGKGSGTAIAVIALLISVGLGGFIVYDKFIMAPKITTEDTPTTNQYFKEGPAIYIPSGEAWTSGSYLLIEFNLTEGQSVYYSFEGLVLFDDSSVPETYIELHFKVDGIIWDYPRRYIWRYSAVTPGGLKFSVSMQHYNTSMTSGTHNVTVVCKGSHTVDLLSDRSLFVQTFN